MHIQSPSIVKKFIQAFLRIFKDIEAYSATLTRAQQGGKEEASPALFENQKRCPDFRKERPGLCSSLG